MKTQLPFAGTTPSDTVYGVYRGLWKKFVNSKDAMERDNTHRAMEFASPSFMEAILKAYRMADQGATPPPKGKVLTDEQGKPIKLETGEAIAQAAGIRPERLAWISGEHWTMSGAKRTIPCLGGKIEMNKGGTSTPIAS